MPNLKGYSDDELVNIADKIWKRTRRDLAGGLDFGLDFPTFRACFPHRASVFLAIRDELRSRR